MNRNYLIKAVFLTGVIFGSASAFAAINTGVIDTCTYPRLVTNIINGTTNNTVCVDVPVELEKTKTVFNLDSQAVTTSPGPNGTTVTTPVGPRHMWMLGTATLDRINSNLTNPSNVSIIGIFHGTAATWALSDAWWQAHGSASGNPYKVWIDRLLAFKNLGVNVQLEICGVTMSGNGWTNADVYPGIHVNQGAIGRLIDLEQNGWTYIQEGFVDNGN